jgi:hypothetical protein
MTFGRPAGAFAGAGRRPTGPVSAGRGVPPGGRLTILTTGGRTWLDGPTLTRHKEEAVTARGVLFAITDEDREALLGMDDDAAVADYVSEVIEERWERGFLAETDKAWDAMHRCLTDGRLEFGNGTFPLNRCIL